ncbi:MAG: helix-turn-helix domain-containing protein [Protaetiibacter sp.]
MLVTTPDDIANIVRDRRTDLGLSQLVLASRIGMSRQWVVRFEGGHASAATIELLTRLARALDLDLDLSPDPR